MCVIVFRKPQETAKRKNVIEHPPVFIFTTCASSASIFEKIERFWNQMDYKMIGLEQRFFFRGANQSAFKFSLVSCRPKVTDS